MHTSSAPPSTSSTTLSFIQPTPSQATTTPSTTPAIKVYSPPTSQQNFPQFNPYEKATSTDIDRIRQDNLRVPSNYDDSSNDDASASSEDIFQFSLYPNTWPNDYNLTKKPTTHPTGNNLSNYLSKTNISTEEIKKQPFKNKKTVDLLSNEALRSSHGIFYNVPKLSEKIITTINLLFLSNHDQSFSPITESNIEELEDAAELLGNTQLIQYCCQYRTALQKV